MSQSETHPDNETRPSRTALLALTGLGLLSALWALFLWYQLLQARAGFEPFCAFGGSGCGQLWDGNFASRVHRFTLLPVAAWGVVWGVAAASLPLRALGALGPSSDEAQTDEAAPESPETEASPADPNPADSNPADSNPAAANAIGAIRWTGLAGLVGMVGLLLASAAEGLFCSSCALTYVLTLAYAATVFFGLKSQPVELGWPSLRPALVAVGLAWAVLLLPGLKTPESPFRQAEEALGLADGGADAPRSGAQGSGADAGTADDRAGNPEADSLADHPLRVPTWPLEPDEQERRLRDFLGQMEPNLRQFFSDYLDAYRQAEPGPDPAPRNLLGPEDATTKLTEFTETRCGHCAELFVNLKAFMQLFPPAALAVDSRHFPLDGHCNPGFPIRDTDQTSCVAAKARICLEGHEGLLAYEEQLYRNQQELTEAKVLELAAPFMAPAFESTDALQTCIDDVRTDAKLQEDIRFAEHFHPDGTPLVLINGRHFTAIAPFLYALTLAGSDPDHPAFADLPAPRPLPEHRH